ncbi:hypothetical protein QBC41DRAFT_264114 [Cercophora samala]|uniref:Uncharacterized protein n=1 Tax=Cercophora samala TaxID=330535 RepID=A0AA40DEX7_9PEZI|nr:hypothetical protein QBC41DRAFT_264114 [Cercophora samala]
MRISTFCQLAFFGISVEGLAFPGPQPTGVIALEDSLGWTPKPTEAPAAHGLLRRQNGRPSNYIAAPDNTCGYLDGNKRDPLTCADDQQCIFITASAKAPAGVGCCGNGGCNFHTACLDRKDLKECDEDCQADPQILKCSAFGKQLCNTISYGLGAVDYYCSIFRQRSVEEADTTHVGQKGRTMSTITPTSTSTRRTTTAVRSSSSLSRSSGSASSSETDTETETSATDRSLETGSSSVDTAPAATSSDAVAAVPAESSSSNTGAIAGGVIGAIGAIALIAFALIFFRRRKRDQEGQTQIPDGPPPPPMYQQPSSQPPSQPPSQPQTYQQSPPPPQPSAYANSQATTYQQSSYQPSQYEQQEPSAYQEKQPSAYQEQPPSAYQQQQPSTYQQQLPPQPVPVVSPFSDPPRQHQSHSETPSFTSISSSSAASAIPPPLKLSSAATSPYLQQATPAQFSPLSGSTIAALATIPDTQNSPYHNHHHHHPPPEKSPNYYPAPSPMSTPAASPRFSFDGGHHPPAPPPQPLQPYRPESAAYPNQPQYQPKQYKPFVPNNNTAPTTSATYMPSATESMDSPMSAYGALPVSPVSALGSHPMEELPVVLATGTAGTRRQPSVRRGSGEKGTGGGGVPLVLQPGLGAQRFAPGTVRQVTVQRGMSRRGREGKGGASPVQQQEGQQSAQGSPVQASQLQQQQQQQQAVIGAEGKDQEGRQAAQVGEKDGKQADEGVKLEKEAYQSGTVAAAAAAAT